MVKKRKGAIIRKVKDISIGSALTLVLLGGSALLQSCDSSEEGTGEETTELVNEEVFTKSVQTHITEVSPRVFRITDEKVVEEEGKSSAVITYLSGKTDTLTIEQARAIVEKQHQADSLRALASTQGMDSTKKAVDTTQKQNGAASKAYQTTRSTNYSSGSNNTSYPSDHTYGDHHPSSYQSSYNSSSHFDNSLGTMLMVGGMGYMMGSTVNSYRTRYLEDADRRQSSGTASRNVRTGSTSSGTSRYYSNPETHAKTQTAHTNLKSSRVTVSRPASSQSGFFNRSSGSSSSSSSSKSSSSSGSSYSRSGSS